jgi:multidrug resistance efflux pump
MHDSDNSFHSLKLVSTPKKYTIIRNYLIGIVCCLFLVLLLPWQQNVQGNGKLIPYQPQDRPQTVPSVIGGRIEKWMVQEGQFVNKGDTLAVISEIKEKYFDPLILARTTAQIANKEDAVKAKMDKIRAGESQVFALKKGLKFKLEQTRNKVKQMRFKVDAERAAFEAAKINQKLIQDQYKRLESLYNKGLASLTELQNRNGKTQEANAKLIEVENKFNSTQNELINAEIELNSVEADYLDKISKAESTVNETAGDIFESQAEISKMKIELSNLQMRAGFYVIRAPQDGFIVKAMRSGIGENIKEGEPLLTIMPANAQMAVEMFIRPMDLPLMHAGVKVRVQFDGWPALVFSGWPNIGVGTFGGVVSAVDKVNSANGLFRVLVIPDSTDMPWPEALRSGSGVYSWAMLNRVMVWYELWRQFNGFPPEYNGSLKDPLLINSSENSNTKK